MSDLLKNLLIALGLAALLFVGYLLFSKDDSDLITSTGEAFGSEASRETQIFLTRIKLLESINLDDSIVSDPRFTSLTDFRQELTPEPVGRKNPFAPVR